ncbi:MAG TPA: acyclic terpene utilization AtuA family protein [Burkholderiaceae bacterium]|nr:acyclic terpene utilization AtuA family protein [Burkholderiaceae bacterium]
MAKQDGIVRIAGASGFWGDTAIAVPQLLGAARLDYIVFDYLAELTMSILAMQRAKDAASGYATDFVRIVMRESLPELKRRGVKVVANAGGVNPLACRDALLALAGELGIALKVGVVLGDDLRVRADAFAAAGVTEMFSGTPLPTPTKRIASINAYLGAFPIARALEAGCDVVITGRCVDSATTLGVLIHEFGWSATDLDRLAQGTLAGHLIECGAQGTGGLYTDWEDVPDWENIGFPIVEVSADGSFVITKPTGTGGLVTPASVTEQMLYEIADPRAYLVPDVVCDFTGVTMTQAGAHRVEVRGAIGRAPTEHVKVSATYADGYRNAGFLTIAGEHAAAKARRTGAALLARMVRMLAARGLPPFTETRLEVLGAEDMYGAQARPAVADGTREVVLKLAAKSSSKESLELFAREFAPAATSMAPGTLGLVGGRPSPTPVVRLFSFLWPKRDVTVEIDIAGEREPIAWAPGMPLDVAALPTARRYAELPMPAQAPQRTVPLLELAHGRSGDKGNLANIGVIARRPDDVAWLASWLTPERIAAHFAHRAPSRVERFDLPGVAAINFVLHDVLGGGGMASLHTDNLAKAYAQVLLAMEVPVPPG